MTTTTGAPAYFAVPDPLDPGVMTYWYRVKRGRSAGQLAPWPPKARYHPATWRDIPKGLTADEQREAVLAYYAPVMEARREIALIIDADPDTAAARFAALRTACCHCGKALTDDRSRVYGIDPECRHGTPPALLDRYAAAVGRAHAELLAEGATA